MGEAIIETPASAPRLNNICTLIVCFLSKKFLLQREGRDHELP
jgi:hypothetical protein